MNTRNYTRNQYPQRYNSTGTFVPATQLNNQNQSATQNFQHQQQPAPSQQPAQNQQQAWQKPKEESPVKPEPEPTPAPVTIEDREIPEDGDVNVIDLDTNGMPRKKWVKRGFKVSMREKRRRQNKQLRRLLTPKNALMVLNELTPGSQNECTVVAEGETYGMPVTRSYVASLNVGGTEYRGAGASKLLAKNQAAENVIRDMIIKQMGKVPSADEERLEDDDRSEDQSFPMIQLASYALHKLFSDWQSEGYKVPQLTCNKSGDQSSASSVSGMLLIPKPRKVPCLPSNPAQLHPCMLLSQMRLGLEYTFISSEEVKPNTQFFTMGVTVDNTTFIGKATNKKEARKQAARKACQELFGVVYSDEEKPLVVEEA